MKEEWGWGRVGGRGWGRVGGRGRARERGSHGEMEKEPKINYIFLFVI